jgi:pyruvate/2-oxoglutarate dehydrogenase complex dihydrolipoamide acyltransferase (E2) component
MSTEIIIPKIGFAASEGTLSAWLVDDGAEISEGQPLYELETDKSTQEVESPCNGVLKILKDAGEAYEVGTVIGEIQ